MRSKLVTCFFLALVMVVAIFLLATAREMVVSLEDFYTSHWRWIFWLTPAMAVISGWLMSEHASLSKFACWLRWSIYPIFWLVLIFGFVSLSNGKTLGLWFCMDMLPSSAFDWKTGEWNGAYGMVESLSEWFVILTSFGSALAAWNALKKVRAMKAKSEGRIFYD